MKVSLLFNRDKLCNEIERLRQYKLMIGDDCEKKLELPLENDIGEPGEIYEGAILVTYRYQYHKNHVEEDVSLKSDKVKHVKVAYLPSWIDSILMENISIDEAYVQPSDDDEGFEGNLCFGEIDCIHVNMGMSWYAEEVGYNSRGPYKTIIHGDLNKCGDDGIKGNMAFDENYRYLENMYDGKFVNHIESIRKIVADKLEDENVQDFIISNLGIREDCTADIFVHIVKLNEETEYREISGEEGASDYLSDHPAP